MDNAVDLSLLVAKDSGFTLDSHFLLLRDFGLYAVKLERPQEIGRLQTPRSANNHRRSIRKSVCAAYCSIHGNWHQAAHLLEVWTHVEHLVHDIFYTDHACRLAKRLFYHSVVVQCNPALVNSTIATLVNQLLRIK